MSEKTGEKSDEKAGGKATPPTKRFKRKLTPFLCREMLYDYVAGEMDEERRAAVAACLESDRETQEAHEAIERGLACAEALSRVAPAPDLMAHLARAETALSIGRRYSRWENWPETLRWSIVAIGASAGLAAGVSLAPWRLLRAGHGPADAVVLAPITKPEDAAAKLAANADSPEAAAAKDLKDVEDAKRAEALATRESSGDEDEGAPVKADVPLPAAPPSAKPPIVAATKPIVPAAKPQNASVAKPQIVAAAPPPPSAKPAPPAAAEEHDDRSSDGDSGAAAAAAPAATPEKRDPKAKGFVYRAWLNTPNVEESTPKIVDVVRELGGEKAGEVELGWRRGAGSYFHFAMPEKNEQEILDRLKAYGRVRISKDSHPRVMPAGQIRFILWVEADRTAH